MTKNLHHYTPAMQQYVTLKQQHPDALLFFQLGDFYELFFEEAQKVSKILGLTLTHRGHSKGDPIPMCGVPLHSSEVYIARLLKEGFKIALCQQTQKASEALKGKAPLARSVTKILTPGTVVEDTLLDSSLPNFLMVITPLIDHFWGVALVDSSTGDILVEQRSTNLSESVCFNWSPRELLIPFEFFEHKEFKPLLSQFEGRISSWPKARFDKRLSVLKDIYGANDHAFLLQFQPAEVAAIVAGIQYTELALGTAPRFKLPQAIDKKESLHLDPFTVKSLELYETTAGQKEGSLLWAIDRTLTPLGRRFLLAKMQAPSKNIKALKAQLARVTFFAHNPSFLKKIRHVLQGHSDVERALRRLELGIQNPQDLGALKLAIEKWNTLSALLQEEPKQTTNSERAPLALVPKMTFMGESLHTLLKHLNALKEGLPRLFVAGKIIHEGCHGPLNSLQTALLEVEKKIKALEASYQSALHIPLKIKRNNLIGLHIEITKQLSTSLPGSFYLKQGLASSARYGTLELTKLEEALNKKEAEIESLEKTLFLELIQEVLRHKNTLLEGATFIARLDYTTALAALAVENNFVEPKIVEEPLLTLEKAWHPSIQAASEKKLTPNDCVLNAETSFMLITAPNMAGKSTYLRQNALILLMAHMGSFVPAAKATIGITDKIFSRVGASDNLAKGESTFMVEMMETATILNQATKQSFVILDEVGRGTSTDDGEAIANACIDYLAAHTQCRTLFATHYFDLTKLEKVIANLACYTLRIKKWEDQIIFLHHVISGISDGSYGLNVAKMAGFPEVVLKKALEVKKTQGHTFQPPSSHAHLKPVKAEPSLYKDLAEPPLCQKTLVSPSSVDWLFKALHALDLNEISPKKAWNLLEDWKKMLHTTQKSESNTPNAHKKVS